MLRRWAVLALTNYGRYDIDSWHITQRGADRRRAYRRRTHADRDTVMLVMPRRRALDMAGVYR